MHKIKFTHVYNKLLDESNNVVSCAILLGVYEINLEDQHSKFIEYDTDYGKFPLPKRGKYLMLLFEKIKYHRLVNNKLREQKGRHLFTTLRRSTPEKLKYYKSCVGQEFSITSQ